MAKRGSGGGGSKGSGKPFIRGAMRGAKRAPLKVPGTGKGIRTTEGDSGNVHQDTPTQ